MRTADLFNLSGRTAIVTGAGRNIGREIALVLASAGAAVVVNGRRDQVALESVVAEIEAQDGHAMPFLADVSDPAAVESMVGATEQRFGAVDIIVSNVGLRRYTPFLEISLEEWRHIIDVNLGASFNLARAALPGMRERRWGRLIHLSGLPVFTGDYPGRVHVLAAKSGLQGLSRGIAREFGAYGITSNIVAPGMVDTIRDWSQYPNTDPAEIVKSVPLGRLARVGDVAATCLYLASEAGAFVTGQTIHVNGGQGMF